MISFFDGQKSSDLILKNIQKQIRKKNVKLCLAAVLVGKNKASEVFIRQKQIACKKTGIGFKLYRLPSDIGQRKLEESVKKICKISSVSGVVIQLPLPPKINVQKILNLVPEKKDPDILSEDSLGKFFCKDFSILPPVVRAVSIILKNHNLKEKSIALVGTGRLVGLPLAVWLIHNQATVLCLNKFTKNIAYFTKKADIIISGVGKPGIIKGSMVRKGAIVLDIGACFRAGKIIGDADYKSIFLKTKKIASVPGGAGPLTVACLLENVLRLNS